MSSLPKNHYLHLENGRFAETTAQDLRDAFTAFSATPSKNGFVIHFHGGLVSQSTATTTAEKLMPVYQSAGTWPFFFLWESGLIETVANNLRDIAKEPFFRKVVAKLTSYLLGKISGWEAVSALESAGQSPEQQVERWLTSGGDVAPFDQTFDRADMSTVEVQESELRRVFRDADTLTAFNRLREATIVQSGAESASSAQQLTLNKDVAKELFGDESADVETEFVASAVWVGRVARVAAHIGARVVRRFASGRNHGLLTTVIEESLRELYLDSIVKTVFWNQMKKDTADAFGGEPSIHGGTAMLEQLRGIVSSNPDDPPRVTLVGHSAGAIYVSNFLIAADEAMPSGFKFDVILLAAAVDCELFSKAIATGRIRNIRQFAMSDKLESEDALLATFHPALAPVYPRSLLYFVSGLLETDVDLPLVGMQRYYSATDYPSGSFENLKLVRDFLQPYPDRLVWSREDSGLGRHSESIHHGDFDDADRATIESVSHILSHGYVSQLEVTRSSVEESMKSFTSKDVEAIVQQQLPQASNDIESIPMKANISDLLDDAAKRPGGYTQLMIQAHRVRPDAQILQQHQYFKSRKTDVAVEQALSRPVQVQQDPGLESIPSQDSVRVPVLIRVRDANESLQGVEGLRPVSKVGTIIAARVNQAAISRLENDARVISIEYSEKGTLRECVASMPFIRVIDPTDQARLPERGDRALIGIIDAGIDVLHAAFRTPDQKDANGNVTKRGATRLLAVWDQRDDTGPAPPGLEGVGGTLHTAAEINSYIESQTVGKKLSRDENPILVSSGHGTHVASIAAGSPLPEHGFPGGVAPDAQLIVVITESPSKAQHEVGSPNSLGYSVSHNAALQFVGQIAEGDIDDDGLFEQIYGVNRTEFDASPVVVNFSQGMNAGAHDGTSLVESMFDDFCLGGRARGRVVVKSAGNDRQKKRHAFVSLGTNSVEDLKWESPPASFNGQRTRDVIELWFDSTAELSFRLVSPTGEESVFVSPSNPQKSDSFASGNTYLIDYQRFFVDNGKSRLRVEINNGNAAAIEAAPKGPPAPRDHWKLELVSGALAIAVDIDAWIDGTDAKPIVFANHVNEDRTLSVPGTARSVISVGAIGADVPLRVGEFSAYGRTWDGREKPEVSAPGLQVSAARGGTEFRLRRDSGTSMAAPHVAGAIALVLSACDKSPNVPIPNANQIAGAFRSASWDRGSGYGPLNVKELIESFL